MLNRKTQLLALTMLITHSKTLECAPRLKTAACCLMNAARNFSTKQLKPAPLAQKEISQEQKDLNNAFLKAAQSKIGTAALISLIRRGADPLATDEKGRTALHLAAYVGATDVVSFLLKEGLSVHIQALHTPETARACHDTKPLDYAMAPHELKADYQQHEIVQMLIDASV